ncbi:SulP family inorganic anion transporter [Candidatus Gracilibacteria bacterium]|nr:SulP family inorganic anion transporter [Candidatus Gracilibacteria bacterium]
MFLLHYLQKHNFIDLEKKGQTKADILSGLTVALALIPEAIAFSFVAEVNPMVGLWAAFIMGLITAIFGGRPGMISGATGAMAVVMTSLVVMHGVEFLFAAIILAGIIQILFGVFKLGKLVRLIPHPVMLGFVNGLAIIILLAQFGQFKVDGEWLSGTAMIVMALLILLTMAIIQFLPKLTKALPSGLVAIVVVSLLVAYIPALTEVRTVASYLAENGFDTLEGAFPSFHIPQINISFIEMLKIILPYSAILAVIGLTESLMTLTLIDELTETRGKSNKESIAQGLANTTCGFFGAMGGCAMIGQSMININNGGRKRLSGITASVFLILFVVFGTAYIVQIPLAALVGLMFMVVIGTFAWPTLKILNKIPKADSFVMIAVTVITVVTGDLAIAVVSGVVIAALVFAWEKAEDISVVRRVDKKNRTHYDLDGPLFFGSITKFKELFDIQNDTKEIIIDFANSKVVDHSAIEAINNLTGKYLKAGKKLHLRHLSPDCKKLLKNAEKIIDINVLEDPKYRVADDALAG